MSTEGTPETTETPAAEAAPEAPKSDLKWYVVHTYSGFENRAKKSLEERVKQQSLEDQFGEILVPKETVEEMRGGTKRTSKRKFFPGYVLVQMEMTDQTWHLVKDTPKVTGFVGGDSMKKPPASYCASNSSQKPFNPSEGARTGIM